MIRKGEWKLVKHSGYEEPQLFNLADDPGEANDLGSDPAHSSKREELLDDLFRYWDEDEVARIYDENLAHDKIYKQWVQSTKVEGIEEWYADIGKNYLLEQ